MESINMESDLFFPITFPPTPVLLPGKSHGWRSLVGCSPWGRQESDTTERLHFHFSLSCIGEGNGNPLQYSCLENPRDGGAWWAAIYGVGYDWSDLAAAASHFPIVNVHSSFLWERGGNCSGYFLLNRGTDGMIVEWNWSAWDWKYSWVSSWAYMAFLFVVPNT